MSIIWDWSDDFAGLVERHQTCFLSGEKLEPPFMIWQGYGVIAINAKSMVKAGDGLLLDLAMLSYFGRKIDAGRNAGELRKYLINRIADRD